MNVNRLLVRLFSQNRNLHCAFKVSSDSKTCGLESSAQLSECKIFERDINPDINQDSLTASPLMHFVNKLYCVWN